MQKQMIIDLYQVEMPDNSPLTFEQLLAQVCRIPTDETRNVQKDRYPIRCHSLRPRRGFFEGEMIRIRMDEVPVKASLAGEIEPFELDDDEGVGEETGFLYNIPLRVLILQRNRAGVSASAFAWYFKNIGNLAEYIYLNPIIIRDVLDRLVS